MPSIPRRIGITAGDPAGIGLEVVLKSLPAVFDRAQWVLFTDPASFDRHYVRFGQSLPYRWISSAADVTDEAVLFVVDVPGSTCPIPWGDLQEAAGRRALAYLEAAGREAVSGRIEAIVTAPVNKQAIGRDFHGQTEFLADLSGSRGFAMAFFTPTFKVVLATIHVPLKHALEMLSTARYIQLIEFVSAQMNRLGWPAARIAVAGINPHAGEDGMFGREDLDLLKPAVDACAAAGIRVSGPHSADSLYYRAHQGEFDVVIAPYHDQGLIPVKLIAHGTSTNVTLGLPFIRTSPDHGTAFEIAGKGIADFSGMTSAMVCALELLERRNAAGKEGPDAVC